MYLPPWSDCTTRQLYSLQGDTVLQGISYKKCFKQDFSLASGWQSSFTLTPPNYIGALREDTNARKVFAFNPYLGQEVLMYDFALEQGDTLAVLLQPFEAQNDQPRLFPIDSVTTLPDGRKKWHLEGYIEMVEGAGYSVGLFPGEICFEVCSNMNCVKEGGLTLFDATNWPFAAQQLICDYVVSQQNVFIEKMGPSIYPNPSNGEFYVTKGNLPPQITICDVQGRWFIINTDISSSFDLTGFPMGMYFAKMPWGWERIVKW